jgi:hypothetical protein
MEQAKFIIADILPRGRENAIDIEDIKRLTGIESTRVAQREIARERKHGAIICSGNDKGYWLPSDRAEAEKFYKSMRRRALSTLAACRGVRQMLEMPEGQQDLKFGGGNDGEIPRGKLPSDSANCICE